MNIRTSIDLRCTKIFDVYLFDFQDVRQAFLDVIPVPMIAGTWYRYDYVSKSGQILGMGLKSDNTSIKNQRTLNGRRKS